METTPQPAGPVKPETNVSAENSVKDEINLRAKSAWISFLETIYNFPAAKRFIVIAGIIMLLPAYWLTRIGTDWYYDWQYGKQLLRAHASFSTTQTIKVVGTGIFGLQNGNFVAYAKINNPNLDISGYNIPYTFAVVDSKDKQVYTTSGQTYILPGGDQYITTPAFSSIDDKLSATLTIADVTWQKRLQIPEIKLVTPTVEFTDSPDGLLLEGTVVNESSYQLRTVRMTFIIYDKTNQVVGVTQRDEFDVRPADRRTFPQVWPGLVSASDISRIEPIASSNPLDVRNLSAPTQ